MENIRTSSNYLLKFNDMSFKEKCVRLQVPTSMYRVLGQHFSYGHKTVANSKLINKLDFCHFES